MRKDKDIHTDRQTDRQTVPAAKPSSLHCDGIANAAASEQHTAVFLSFLHED